VRRLSSLVYDLTTTLRELSQPSWGALFWTKEGNRGESWGHAPDLPAFTKALRADFKSWGIRDPFVIAGPAWRIHLVKWALKRDLHLDEVKGERE
jgi:hypothetical protein